MEQEASRNSAFLKRLDDRRMDVTGTLDRKHRSSYGQFFTPGAVARYMASLLDFPLDSEIRLLDPGARIGSLTAAAAHACDPESAVQENPQRISASRANSETRA